MCRKEKVKIFPNKQLDREIKELHVYCVNARSGCTWSGEINDLDKHINNDCPFLDVSCPSKCGVMLKKKCVQQHIAKECPCHCQYCGVTRRKEEISKTHKERCSQYPSPCPKGCELGVAPGVRIAEHKKICPLEVVQCDYHDIGCKDLIIRKELQDHYKQKVPEHLALIKCSLAEKLITTENHLVKFMEDTKQNFNKLTVKMKTVEDHVTKISAKVEQTRQLHAGM